MEDDIDIYEDLPSINAEQETGHHYGLNDNDQAIREHEQLRKQIDQLSTELENFRKVNEILEVNLASLLKTARAEITRKDRMIAELRRELDDLSFRRGTYTKATKTIKTYNLAAPGLSPIHHPTINRHWPRDGIKLESVESMDSDGPFDETDDQHYANQSNLPSVTVYGQRLRKKLVDEDHAEGQRKERQQSKINVDRNSNEFVEGYIAESDKENGSRRNVRSIDSKENQSRPIQIVRVSNEESVDGSKEKATPMTTIKSELNSIDETKVEGRVCQGASKLSVTTYFGKRRNEEAGESISVKRLKFEQEEIGYQNESPSREGQGVDDYVRLSGKRTTWNKCKPERAVDSIRERRTNRRMLGDSREKDGKRNVNGHIMKRLSLSNEKPKRGFDERSLNRRSNENSRSVKRDAPRINEFDCYHRTKHRETHRIERRTIDHRLYTKSWNSHFNFHDERQISSKFDKNTNYGEKRYSNGCKSTFTKISIEKAECNLQSAQKRPTAMFNRKPDTALTEMNRRRKDDRRDSRRLRTTDRLLASKRERERSSDINKTIVAVKVKQSTDVDSPFSCFEDSKPELKDFELTKNVCKPSNESSVSIKTDTLVDICNSLEDGQLPPTPTKDEQSMDKKEENGYTKNAEKLGLGIRYTSPIDCNFLPTGPQGSRNSDVAENVENIEKFLRDYKSVDRGFENEKTSLSSMPEKQPGSIQNKNHCNAQLSSTDVIALHESISTGTKDKVKLFSQFLDLDDKQNDDDQHDSNSSSSRIRSSDKTDNVASPNFEGSPTRVPEAGILVKQDYTIPPAMIREDDGPKQQTNSVTQNKSSVLNDYQLTPSNGNVISMALELNSNGSDKTDNNDKGGKYDCTDLDGNENGTKKKDNDVCDGGGDSQGGNHDCDSDSDAKKQLTERNVKHQVDQKEKLDETNVASKSTKALEKEADTFSGEQELLLKVCKSKRMDRSVSQVKVQGKLVVFSHRRKPVCLADNNASMTVLVNCSNRSDNSTINVASTGSSSGLKIRTCKSSRFSKST